MSREKTASLQRCNPLKKQEIVKAFAGVMLENGASINQTAEATGLGRQAVIDAKKNPEKVKSLSPSELTGLQNCIASKLMRVADTITDALPHKIDSANLLQASTSLGVVLDKARLILGLSTGRVESVNLTLHKLSLIHI